MTSPKITMDGREIARAIAKDTTKPVASAADGLIALGLLLAFVAAFPLFGAWVALFGLGLVFVGLGAVKAIKE